LKWSSEAELLELLFCFFDADGDDKVGLNDLERAIDTFLALDESTAAFPEAEKKEFRKLADGRKLAEIKRIAGQILKEFAAESEDEEGTDEVLQESGGTFVKLSDRTATSDPPDKADSDAARKAEGEAEKLSTSSKVAETGKLQMPKKRGGGLCGRAPKEDSPPGEFSPPDPKAKAEAKAVPKPKASAKPKPKPGGGLCGAKKPKTLSFRQWCRWILTTEVLPPGLLEAAREASKPKPKPPEAPAIGVGTQEMPSEDISKSEKQADIPALEELSVAGAAPLRSPSEDTLDGDDTFASQPTKPLLSAVS